MNVEWYTSEMGRMEPAYPLLRPFSLCFPICFALISAMIMGAHRMPDKIGFYALYFLNNVMRMLLFSR